MENIKGISITSLILGILGLILGWLPCGMFLGVPMILIGFIMAIVAVSSIRNTITVSAITINSAALFWALVYYISVSFIFTNELLKIK